MKAFTVGQWSVMDLSKDPLVCFCVCIIDFPLHMWQALAQCSQSICKAGGFFFFSISAVWCRKTCCTDQLTVLDIPLPYRLISLTQSHAQLAEYMYMTNSVNRIINRNCYVMVSYVFSYVLLLGTHFFFKSMR